MPGKRVTIDGETWTVPDLLASDRMGTFQELADEAFADLLKKHGRPVGLKAALRKSAGVSAEVIPLRRAPRKKRQKAEASGSAQARALARFLAFGMTGCSGGDLRPPFFSISRLRL